jgi:hypothetical protein
VRSSKLCEECGISLDEIGDHRGSAAKELSEIRKQRARKNHRGWQTYNPKKKVTETREFPGCTEPNDTC